MTKVVIYRDYQNMVSGYKISGHSGYDKTGKDIVCAAVSSVCQATALGLDSILGIQVHLEIKDAYIHVELPDHLDAELRERADILLETMILFLKQLCEQYSKYVQMIEQEV